MNNISVPVYRIISLAVIALIVVTLIIPTIDGLQTKHVVEQEADESYHMLSSSEVASSTYTLFCDTGDFCINDERYGYDFLSYPKVIAASDTFSIVLSGDLTLHIQGIDDEYEESSTEIILNKGILSANTHEDTIVYNELCILSDEGNYGLFNLPFIINPESKVFVTTIYDSEWWCTLFGDFDSLVGPARSPYEDSLAYAEAVLNVSDNHNGSLLIHVPDDIEITITTEGPTYTGTATVDTILAPKSYYYYEKSSQSIIWGIIPLLLLIVPIVYAARMVTDNRGD